IGAAEAAREQAHEIEMAEERGAADLRESDAIRRIRQARTDVAREPHALGAFGLAIARRLRDFALGGAAATALGDVAEHAPRVEAGTGLLRRLGRSGQAQPDKPVRTHLRQIARDAAVVADELAPIGLRLAKVRVMDEHAGDLAARRTRPALHRLAVLA